ncbi:MAG: sulfatase-like hydrolase/transferase [Planctomycetota bacterium]
MRLFVFVSVAVLVSIVSSGVSGEDTRPNIVFVMADDLGKEWLSVYGAEDHATPRLDRMAAEGMLFTNAYSTPKCTPTRVQLLTAMYPFRTGWVNHWDVPRWGAGCHFDAEEYTTFAEVMRMAGYATAAAGKWQINDFRVQPTAMHDHGFDDWCMWTGGETDGPAKPLRYWEPYINTPEGSRTWEGRYGPDVFNDFVIEFLGRQGDKPAMVYYPMALPHTPLVTTPHEPDVTTKREKLRAMVGYVDYLMGRLLDAIEAMDSGRPTIVIFTTDNGSAGGQKMRMNGRAVTPGKGRLTENGSNAPFIVWGPGLVPPGVTSHALTDFSDMLPTFAELGGARVPSDLEIDGQSIAPVILGEAVDGPREWIMSMGGGVAVLTEEGRIRPEVGYAPRVVRDERFKMYFTDGMPAKLIDLVEDPQEKVDLMASVDPVVVAAREKLAAAGQTFPETDAWPRYTPTLPQPWDVVPGEVSR